MDRSRATQVARVIERFNLDLQVKDPNLQRLGRLERVQSAWLRGLGPRGAPGRKATPPR
jgi:hypothetical protein